MNLDEMKDQWAVYDRKLDTAIRLNTAMLRASSLDRADSALTRLSRWIWLELVITFIAIIPLGMFIAGHVREPEFLAPAIALQLGATLLVVACIWQLSALASLDYSGPVVAIQRRLEQLRIVRIRTTKWTAFIAPLLWTPLFIVMFEGLFGVNVYRVFDTAWLVANFAFGVALIPLLVWISKRFANRFGTSTFMQQLMNDIAGHNLTTALQFLGSLSSFEEEE